MCCSFRNQSKTTTREQQFGIFQFQITTSLISSRIYAFLAFIGGKSAHVFHGLIERRATFKKRSGMRSVVPESEVNQKGLRIASAWLQTLSQNGYGAERSKLEPIMIRGTRTINRKSQQHPKDFPGGPPPQYWPGPATVNFGVRKRSGVFGAVWPLATVIGGKGDSSAV